MQDVSRTPMDAGRPLRYCSRFISQSAGDRQEPVLQARLHLLDAVDAHASLHETSDQLFDVSASTSRSERDRDARRCEGGAGREVRAFGDLLRCARIPALNAHDEGTGTVDQIVDRALTDDVAAVDDGDRVAGPFHLVKEMEESITVRPSLTRLRIISRISSMPAGSSPFIGSSRIKSFGSARRQAAMPRRWRMPME